MPTKHRSRFGDWLPPPSPCPRPIFQRLSHRWQTRAERSTEQTLACDTANGSMEREAVFTIENFSQESKGTQLYIHDYVFLIVVLMISCLCKCRNSFQVICFNFYEYTMPSCYSHLVLVFTSQQWLTYNVCWLVGCLTSQQQASVSQGRICEDNFNMLPHWDRSCRSNVLPHPVTVHWHRADQSQCWPYNARRLAG